MPKTILAIPLALLAALPLAAQEGDEPPEKMIQFNFREAPVDSVLEYLSKETGLIVNKKVPVSGRVTAVSAEKIPVSRAIAFINSVLIDQQIAAIRSGNEILILSLENAIRQNSDIVVVNDPEQLENSQRILTAVIRLQYLDPAEVKKEFQTLIGEKGLMFVNTTARSLVISDTSANIRRFLDVVSRLDGVLGGQLEVGYFKLTYAKAADVGKVIEDLFGTSSGSSARSGGNANRGGRGGRGGDGGGDPRMQFFQRMLEGAGGDGSASGATVDVKVATDERSNTVIVTATKSVLAIIEGIVARLDQRVTDPLQIRVYPLAYANPEDVAKIVKDTFSPQSSSSSNRQSQNQAGGGRMQRLMQMWGMAGNEESSGTTAADEVSVSADVRTNSVVVVASAEIQGQVKDLIEQLDTKVNVGKNVRIYRLENASAEEIQRILAEIYGDESIQSSSGSASARTTNQQRGGGAQGNRQGTQNQGRANQGRANQGNQNQGNQGGFRRPRSPDQEEEEGEFPEEDEEDPQPPGPQEAGVVPADSQIKVSIDPRTNTIIVTGGDELDSVDQLIRRLDTERGEVESTLVVRLRNHDATALEPILEALLEPSTSSTSTSLGPLVGETRVRADQTTNSLIFVTNNRNRGILERLVAQLDVEPPQVLIKAYVIEVDLDDATEFGVEGNWLDTLGDRFDDTFASDFDLTAETDGFTYRMVKEDANVLLRAIQRSGNLDVLSAPRILVQDNQEAEINIGSEVPFVTNSRLTDQGTTLNTIEYRNVGIILSVTPHVNPDGLVRMLIAPEVSEIAPESQSVVITEGVRSPVFLTNTASTTITVQHGHTILMGGLIRNRETETETKVPILGDIPLLGYLFKSTITEKRKVELVILVTPYVLFRARDLPYLTDFELDQLEFIDRRHIEPVAPRIPFEILDE